MQNELLTVLLEKFQQLEVGLLNFQFVLRLFLLDEDLIDQRSGDFRIKGLNPQCNYQIYLKNAEGGEIIPAFPSFFNLIVGTENKNDINFSKVYSGTNKRHRSLSERSLAVKRSILQRIRKQNSIGDIIHQQRVFSAAGGASSLRSSGSTLSCTSDEEDSGDLRHPPNSQRSRVGAEQH
uniref:Rap-GAP domain-containing protein n=1 Tax=Meloidogyne incognita TaxID=6306 RepID=A0A914NGU3_MELIC